MEADERTPSNTGQNERAKKKTKLIFRFSVYFEHMDYAPNKKHENGAGTLKKM